MQGGPVYFQIAPVDGNPRACKAFPTLIPAAKDYFWYQSLPHLCLSAHFEFDRVWRPAHLTPILQKRRLRAALP